MASGEGKSSSLALSTPESTLHLERAWGPLRRWGLRSWPQAPLSPSISWTGNRGWVSRWAAFSGSGDPSRSHLFSPSSHTGLPSVLEHTGLVSPSFHLLFYLPDVSPASKLTSQRGLALRPPWLTWRSPRVPHRSPLSCLTFLDFFFNIYFVFLNEIFLT